MKPLDPYAKPDFDADYPEPDVGRDDDETDDDDHLEEIKALPRVILYAAVSVDGRQDWIQPDLGLFYELAARLGEDTTLVGSNTILAGAASEGWADETPGETGPAAEPGAGPSGEAGPPPGPPDSRPLLVIPDSRGRVRCWSALRACGYWRDVLAVCSAATPAENLSYLDAMGVQHVTAGRETVDLRAMLEWLADAYGARVVRVDGGGILNGALLRAGLVDEVCMLVDPTLVGGLSPRSMFRAEDLDSAEGVVQLELTEMERVGAGSVWLRYAVRR